MSAEASRFDARIGLHERFSTAAVPWPRWVFERLGPLDDALVVEVGAGTGALWRDNADRLPPSTRLVLSDVSAQMCARLAGVCRARRPGPAGSGVLRADAAHLPLPDGCADVLVADHMLYLVPDLAAALRELHRVLRPGGRLVVGADGRGHMAGITWLLGLVGAPARVSPALAAFTLEDAPRWVEEVFGPVRVERFEDELRVDEAGPLVDYLATMAPLGAEQRQALAEWVTGTIEEEGAMTIPRVLGVILAAR